MPEIGTSGLMSGNGKRGGGNVSTRAHPRLYLCFWEESLNYCVTGMVEVLAVTPFWVTLMVRLPFFASEGTVKSI